MTISEVIEALTKIRAAHGDVPVLHHDDWTDFFVEDIEFQPAHDGTDPLEGRHPAHVVLRGERRRFDDVEEDEPNS